MRALLCVPAYKPALDFGGPVTKIALLAPALRDLGVDVEIVTADFGPDHSRVSAGRRVVDGVPVTYLRRLASRGYLSVTFGAGAVIARGFDVVHCFGLRDALVNVDAPRAAARLRVPVVLEPMGMAVPRLRSVRSKEVFDKAVNALVPLPAAVVATSDVEAHELRELGYGNIVMRPNPIAVPPAETRPEPRWHVGYVGRLHAKKRLTDIVAALAAHPDWTAVIAGPDEDGTAAVVAGAANAAGVADRLTLKPWVSSAERDQIIRRMRVFALPSSTENFGNAAAEAVALGTPVVVTDQCGVATLVEETGFGRVVPVDTAAFLNALAAVVEGDVSPDAGALSRYEPPAIAAQQEAIYASVTSPTTRSS